MIRGRGLEAMPQLPGTAPQARPSRPNGCAVTQGPVSDLDDLIRQMGQLLQAVERGGLNRAVADRATAEVGGIARARGIREDPRPQAMGVMVPGDGRQVAAESQALVAGAVHDGVKSPEGERLIVRARQALDAHAERRRLCLRREAAGS